MGRLLTSRLLLAALALGVAGCGSMNYAAQAGDGSFALRASGNAVATNGQVALQAVLPSGDAAPVAWQIASGTNAASLGQGHIDANGIYTAPGSLSADSITVRVEATLTNDAKSTASLAITVHPGFVQPLLPQNVALTPGATADVTAQIAEVDARRRRERNGSAGNAEQLRVPAQFGSLHHLLGALHRAGNASHWTGLCRRCCQRHYDCFAAASAAEQSGNRIEPGDASGDPAGRHHAGSVGRQRRRL